MTKAAIVPSTEKWLEGTGGRIFTRQWESQESPRANLVICHGFNAHSGQYVRAAEEFASRGFAVTALDLRGRGKSEGERFYIDHIDEYVSDLSLAIELGRSRHPELPVYLLGHSAGGMTSVTGGHASRCLPTRSRRCVGPSNSRPECPFGVRSSPVIRQTGLDEVCYIPEAQFRVRLCQQL